VKAGASKKYFDRGSFQYHVFWMTLVTLGTLTAGITGSSITEFSEFPKL
jgi:hypothetical protein